MIGYRKVNTKSNTAPRTIVFSEEDMKEMDASQFGEFRRLVMGAIDPTMFACLFSSFGRPSCPVDLVIGIMFLACFLGVTEKTILSQLKGSIYYQYALCMDKMSDVTIPSNRTLIRMRMRLIFYRIRYGRDLLHEQAEIILLGLARELGLKGEFFRMDSVMLNIYARQLSRSQLLYYVIQGVVLAVVNTSKHELYKNERAKNLTIEDVMDTQKVIGLQTIPYEFAEQLASQADLPDELLHYLQLGDYHSKFYRAGNYAGVSKGILEDATLVWNTYREPMSKRPEFRLFARVLREQCEWVGHLDPHDEGSGGTYAGKRKLRFKLSKTERKEAQKSIREIQKLENEEAKLRHKCDTAAKKYKKAKEKAISASERAEKAKEKGAENYEALADKARDLEEKAEKLYRAYEKLAAESEEALKTIGTALRTMDEADAFVAVEATMEKDVEQMDSSILQSPLDPGATFCEKSGSYYRGYKTCAMEFSDGKGHSMPGLWTTTQNNVSDEAAGAELIRQLGVFRSKYPDIFGGVRITGVADGAFSGNEIDKALKEAGVELVNTDLTGKKVPDHVADFEFDETGKIITKCAGGQRPHHCSISNDGIVSAEVDASECAKCQYSKTCNLTIKGKKATVKASKKQKDRAVFQRSKGTEAYSIIGRFRNGVEALMGLFKKKSPVTRQPIYTMYRVALFNDIAMVATGFSKYLSQKNIPHEEVRLDKGYSDLFLEDEADTESARMEVERDLRRVDQERKQDDKEEPGVPDVFYAPMVIPQPVEIKAVGTDDEQVADPKGLEVNAPAKAEAFTTTGFEETSFNTSPEDAGIPNDGDTETDKSAHELPDVEEVSSASDHQDTGRNIPAQDRSSDTKTSAANGKRKAGPQIQASGGSSSAGIPDTQSADSVLKRLFEAGFKEIKFSRTSRRDRRVKCANSRDAATQEQ